MTLQFRSRTIFEVAEDTGFNLRRIPEYIAQVTNTGDDHVGSSIALASGYETPLVDSTWTKGTELLVHNNHATATVYLRWGDVAVLKVVDYAEGGTDTITVTVGTTVNTLTEATDFDAEVSDAQTATNIAAAIDALTGVAAVASGAYVLVRGDSTPFRLGSGDITAWKPDFSLMGQKIEAGGFSAVGKGNFTANQVVLYQESGSTISVPVYAFGT